MYNGNVGVCLTVFLCKQKPPKAAFVIKAKQRKDTKSKKIHIEKPPKVAFLLIHISLYHISVSSATNFNSLNVEQFREPP